ncbi:MAG TPA: alpha/beta hydrolase [Bacteroidia bacterium]|nr:alpha/beta hydrolase [Bacteroidia bacterium]
MKEDKVISYYHNSQSLGSRILRLFFRIFNIKGRLKEAHFSGKIKRADMPEPPAKLLKGISSTAHVIKDRKVFMFAPSSIPGQKHILFFHGGAYLLNFTLLHWKLITRLVRETNCRVTAPDYPLLPNYSYKERLAMGEQVYKELLKQTSADNIIFIGDSSGGNLALSLAQKLKEDKIAQPAQIILLSPWLDVTMSNPQMEEVSKRDPMLPLGGNKLGMLHAGDRDMKDALVSPLYGSLKGIGKISLFTGTDEILYPDAKLLKSKAEAESVKLNYFEYKHMLHDWVIFPIPEAKIAFSQIVKLLK